MTIVLGTHIISVDKRIRHKPYEFDLGIAAGIEKLTAELSAASLERVDLGIVFVAMPRTDEEKQMIEAVIEKKRKEYENR